jgi:hypothetical protein
LKGRGKGGGLVLNTGLLCPIFHTTDLPSLHYKILCRSTKRGSPDSGGARRGMCCLNAEVLALNGTKSWHSHSKVLDYFLRLDSEVQLFDEQIYHRSNGGKQARKYVLAVQCSMRVL